jgi:hypothetical protein
MYGCPVPVTHPNAPEPRTARNDRSTALTDWLLAIGTVILWAIVQQRFFPRFGRGGCMPPRANAAEPRHKQNTSPAEPNSND